MSIYIYGGKHPTLSDEEIKEMQKRSEELQAQIDAVFAEGQEIAKKLGPSRDGIYTRVSFDVNSICENYIWPEDSDGYYVGPEGGWVSSHLTRG